MTSFCLELVLFDYAFIKKEIKKEVDILKESPCSIVQKTSLILGWMKQSDIGCNPSILLICKKEYSDMVKNLKNNVDN